MTAKSRARLPCANSRKRRTPARPKSSPRWTTGSLTICPPIWVGVAFHGKYRGQRQKWFALRFLGEDSDIDLHAHEPEFSSWKWLTIEELPHVIVPFKRDLHAKIVTAFRHLAKPA